MELTTHIRTNDKLSDPLVVASERALFEAFSLLGELIRESSDAGSDNEFVGTVSEFLDTAIHMLEGCRGNLAARNMQRISRLPYNLSS